MHQARTGRDAAMPRPPPADRPLPRPPGSRPPAALPAHHTAGSPLPRPPGEPIASPEHYDMERPLRRPPGQYAAADHSVPRPPGQYAAADHPVPRPPGQYATDHPAPRPPWPYSDHAPPRRGASSALASCLAATAFLLLAVGGAGAALFLLFRPRPPDIAVAAVRLPAFAAANGTVAFTFEQTAVVRNPNRSPLAHFDSSLRVAYAGGELGYVYIPAGLIDGGRAKDMSASFDVPAFPAAATSQLAASAAATAAAPPVMEVDSLLVVKGRVTVLRVLTHHVQAAKVCRVGVSPLDGRVLGFRC